MALLVSAGFNAVGVRLDDVEMIPCVSQGAAPLGRELTVTEGLDALEQAMLGDSAQVGIIRADWPRLCASHDNPAERKFFAHLGALQMAAPTSVKRSAISSAARELSDFSSMSMGLNLVPP